MKKRVLLLLMALTVITVVPGTASANQCQYPYVDDYIDYCVSTARNCVLWWRDQPDDGEAGLVCWTSDA